MSDCPHTTCPLDGGAVACVELDCSRHQRAAEDAHDTAVARGNREVQVVEVDPWDGERGVRR